MKKLMIAAASTMLLASCSKNDGGNIDRIVDSKDTAKIAAAKVKLEADLARLDKALTELQGGKKETALVSVITVKDTLFNHYVEVQGNVDTKENIIIYPEFSGVLQTLNVKAGQQVSKGQVLGKIEDGGLSQQVAQLETQYALAKTTFERQKRLWDQKIGSEIQFLQAKTTMESQAKAVSQSKAQLAKTIIRAPFSGTIDEIITERGQVVAPGQGLMRIVNLGDMYVTSSVPEAYVGKVKLGTNVDVVIPSLGKTYVGKIRQAANSINAANRTFNIEVAVPNKENLLRPNQVAKLKIIDYSNKNTITVPTNVVQEDGKGGKFVFIVTGSNGKTGTAKKAAVKIGNASDNATEILSGISAGDVIVSEGANTISEGMKLNF